MDRAEQRERKAKRRRIVRQLAELPEDSVAYAERLEDCIKGLCYDEIEKQEFILEIATARPEVKAAKMREKEKEYDKQEARADSKQRSERVEAARKILESLKDGEEIVVSEIFDMLSIVVDGLLGGARAVERTKTGVEKLFWTVLSRIFRPFFCNGIGYLLRNDGVPIQVSSDGLEFSALLIKCGVNPGSPARVRIGKFINVMCDSLGTRADTRLGFHYEPGLPAAYAALERGILLKITRHGFDEVPNGTDGQLFLFPENFQPLLSKPLDPEPEFPKTDRVVRCLFADGHLVRHLFGGLKFEVRTMNEKQVRQLILAYLLFLMMPGVVGERAMLQSLGPSGSGKSFFLEYVGKLLVGSRFGLRPLPEDPKEFENQIVNEFLIAYDNVGHIPEKVRDRLCSAVTGVEVVRRELFTTSGERREVSKATIMLSAIRSPMEELEHQNRMITTNFGAREDEGFVDKLELFKELNQNRDDIIVNLLRRMTLALEALEAQKDYVPRVNVRLAGIATFILRIARHEGWEERAREMLDAWSAEQTGYSLQEDDISTAIVRWIGGKWEKGKSENGMCATFYGVELSATMLNAHLCSAMGFVDPSKSMNLSWRGSPDSLGKTLSKNIKVYESRYGLSRDKSTLQHTRGGYTYKFKPTDEQLAKIQAEYDYERENTPVLFQGVASQGEPW